MDIGPFEKLPVELRLHIWEYVLQHAKPITLTILSSTHGISHLNFSDSPTPLRTLALTKVCRGLRKECLNLFYALNTFKILGSTSRNPITILETFRSAIGDEACSAIRDATLDLGTLSMDSFETVCASHNELDAFVRRIEAMQTSGEWRQHFTAKARFWANYQPADWKSAMLVIELDMDDIEAAWDQAIKEAEKAWVQDAEADFKPILFTLRECRHQWMLRDAQARQGS